MKNLSLRILIPVSIVLTSQISSAQTQVPNTFQSGQPARATEVNANFGALADAIDQNGVTISTNSLATNTNANAISNNGNSIAALEARIAALEASLGEPTWKILDGSGNQVGVPFFHNLQSSTRNARYGIFDIGGYKVILQWLRHDGMSPGRRDVRGAARHAHADAAEFQSNVAQTYIPANDFPKTTIDVFFAGGTNCAEPVYFNYITWEPDFGPAYFGYIHPNTNNVWIKSLSPASQITIDSPTAVDGFGGGQGQIFGSTSPMTCQSFTGDASVFYTLGGNEGINLGPVPFTGPLQVVYE